MTMLLAALTVFGLLTTGASAPDEATRRLLTDMKSEVVQAFVKKDRAALERIYADDYVATDSKGQTRTKQVELSRLGAGSETLESGRYDVVSIQLYSNGTVAVMNGHGHLVWRLTDGTKRNTDYYSFNVFEKRNGEWKYVAAFLP
jgi:ketosteroid isomerase-like protein